MTDKAYASEIDAIKADVKGLRDDVASLLHALGEDIEQRGENAKAEAVRRVRGARAQAEASFDRLGESIEHHPMAALGAAVGLGFLIGIILGRR